MSQIASGIQIIIWAE